MKMPEFLFADNAQIPTVFIIHASFPRFALDVESGEIEVWDEFSGEDPALHSKRNSQPLPKKPWLSTIGKCKNSRIKPLLAQHQLR